MSSVHTFLTLTLVGALVACASSCSSDSEVDLNETSNDVAIEGGVQTASSPAAEDRPANQARQTEGMFFGHVAETMDAGGYTYVRLEKGDESVWAAGPMSSVVVGEELGITLAMAMPDFYSETLGRGFDSVYFVGGFDRGRASTDAPAVVDGESGLISGDFGGSNRSVAPSADATISKVQKPEGGYTVAELWAKSETLAGQPVVFRGKVVKYNSEILDRNWLHVQDGSGDPAQKNHDVTVTSSNTARVGDIVTVRGLLSVDKDFGAGYKYPMIIEDATLDVSM